ncbi:MAG: diguanylate cyclase [Pseudomonadota bacterium]
MDVIAVAFWGAFFGTVGLMVAGAVFAFVRSLHRVAFNAGLASLASALFVAAYIGWLPIHPQEVSDRVLAHISTITSGILAYLLFYMLGLQRKPELAVRVAWWLGGVSLAVLAAGWMLTPHEALVLSSVGTCLLTLVGLGICVRSAVRGDGLAWSAVTGITFTFIAVVGLGLIAVHRGAVPWPVHAVSALAASAYMMVFAAVLWARYAYLVELHEVMAHGPAYDPVTRMRSHAETGQMLGAEFKRLKDDDKPLGVIVISISNFYALEKLHGRAAVNHALFICAARLRRTMPSDVEMGRLADDGFLLMVRNPNQNRRLIQLARMVQARLSKPVVLSTSREPGQLESAKALWAADVGVGVLTALAAEVKASSAVAMGRAMSRTAWSFASRVAWFDKNTGRIDELPDPGAV